ncbi:hypothetical protein [Tenacibaculum sp. 190524A02b]|uniref:hypothetical protein n=1 Tax=Tenacibaculum vairaonense TaxID=3137860 RepID=UPI0031FB971A
MQETNEILKNEVRTIFTIKDNEVHLKAEGFMPSCEKIKTGAFNNSPIRTMLIPYIPSSNLIDGMNDKFLTPGTIINYEDLDSNKLKLRLEYLCFGELFNIKNGWSLIQFSIEK